MENKKKRVVCHLLIWLTGVQKLWRLKRRLWTLVKLWWRLARNLSILLKELSQGQKRWGNYLEVTWVRGSREETSVEQERKSPSTRLKASQGMKHISVIYLFFNFCLIVARIFGRVLFLYISDMFQVQINLDKYSFNRNRYRCIGLIWV